jgi:hypothetical protein
MPDSVGICSNIIISFVCIAQYVSSVHLMNWIVVECLRRFGDGPDGGDIKRLLTSKP